MRTSVQTFARSTFSGGDYELLNRTTLLPNPDYWAGHLWAKTVRGGTHALHAHSSTGKETKWKEEQKKKAVLRVIKKKIE